MERHYRRVFFLCAGILGSGFDADAEEVAQEVFLKVYHRLHQFRGESRFSSWLYRVAYNEAMDRKVRARWRLPHVSDQVLETQPAVDGGTDPGATFQRQETRAQVEACLAELPDLYHSVLRLRYWMELDIAEIGELLVVPTGTVKSYLYRARQALHSKLKQKGVTRDG